MIGYSLKQLLDLVPEALPLVKTASLTEDFPVDSAAGAIASALRIRYDSLTKKASFDRETYDKVFTAVDAFGVSEVVENLENKLEAGFHNMQKSAAEAASFSLDAAQAMFLGNLTGMKDIPSLVKQAEALWEKAQSTGATVKDEVAIYSGNAYISKEAALGALTARYQLTQDPMIAKAASLMSKEASFIPPGQLNRTLCNAITSFDAKHHLESKGFDFYKEACITKSAAVSGTVNLAGQTVSMDTINAIPSSYMESYMGADFSRELQSDPVSAKALIESLPRDSQQTLAALVKHV